MIRKFFNLFRTPRELKVFNPLKLRIGDVFFNRTLLRMKVYDGFTDYDFGLIRLRACAVSREAALDGELGKFYELRSCGVTGVINGVVTTADGTKYTSASNHLIRREVEDIYKERSYKSYVSCELYYREDFKEYLFCEYGFWRMTEVYLPI